MQFTISTKAQRAVLQVEAETYTQAAQKACTELSRKPDGTTRRLTALRTTGEHDKSGWFQGYQRQGDGLNSSGEPFHVM